MKVVVCCLDGENLVGSRKHPVFVTYSYKQKCTMKLPSQHFHCSAFDYFCRMPIIAFLQSQLAWPELRCVYCTGKIPSWFFRHEMSDLFKIG